MIPGYGAHRDGERRCGRRSTVGLSAGGQRLSERSEGCGVGAAGTAADNQVDYDAGKQVKGRKIHALVDTEGLPMRVVVHSAAIQDRARGRARPRQDTQALPSARTDLGRWRLQRLAS